MKRLLTILILCICFEGITQNPQAFKYQAAVRRINGEMVVNQAVAFRISILSGNVSGPVSYSERQSATTNPFGLVTLEIGRGTALSGSFTNIAWGSTSHFVKVEVDTTGGTNYQFMGTSELLSVPYSFSANTATDDHDRDSTNELQTLSKPNDTTISLSKGGGSVSIASGGIPFGNCILSQSILPPPGYLYSGSFILATEEWNAKAVIPNQRSYVECTSWNDKIYCIGGVASPGNPNNEEYDPQTNTWTTKAWLAVDNRYGHGVATANNKIYVIGGSEGGSTKADVFEYDPLTNSWVTKTPLPNPRSSFSIAVANEKIYVMGGFQGTGISSETLEYNPLTNQWITKAPMPSYSARTAANAATVNNKIYVIGNSSTSEFDPVTNIWSQKAGPSIARSSPTVCSVKGKIYAISGNISGAGLKANEEYNPVHDAWTTKLQYPGEGGDDCISANVGNKIYMFDTGYPIESYEYSAPVTFYIHCKN